MTCSTFRAITVAVVVTLPASLSLGAEASLSVARKAPASINNETINQWIEELDNDLYLVRERAMLNLAKVGPAALEPVARAADGDNLEVASRAVRLLLQYSEMGDPDQSLATLERIAELKNRPLERGAAEAILHGKREKHAIAEIRRLGGIEEGHYVVDGEQLIHHLHIGARWKGGDDGLKHVAHLQRLQKLSIHGTPITDRGIAHLDRMDHLERLELYGTRASQPAVEALRKALPAVAVEARRGALLGVGCSPMPAPLPQGGALVQLIQPESAAKMAGIQVGDVITGFNAQPVGDFEKLTAFIGQLEGGERATLEIIRGNETLTKEVVFGKWQ